MHALKHALRFQASINAAYTNDLDRLTHIAETVAPDIVSVLRSLVDQLPGEVFTALAPKRPETGVLTLASRPPIDIGHVLASDRKAPIIWLDNPAHLGNVGAVVRVAAAVGAAAVLTSGRHDPWDPAALRGSAGLHFALPVLRMERIPETNGPLIAIDPEGAPFRSDAVPGNAILAFGSERQGLPSAILDIADDRLALPMSPKVSSLNLATAVAAALYAWRLANPESPLDNLSNGL